MKIIKNNAKLYNVICPNCKSELEVSEGDKHTRFAYGSEYYVMGCPCCKTITPWDELISINNRIE
jgi:uncharacterized protein YbaR (Trm112 family)